MSFLYSDVSSCVKQCLAPSRCPEITHNERNKPVQMSPMLCVLSWLTQKVSCAPSALHVHASTSHVSVSQSVRAAVTKYCRLGSLQTTEIYFTVLEAESWKSES